MPEELVELINKSPACYLATASKDGIPNVVPCGSTTAVDQETIVIAAVFLGKTLENLKGNPKASLVVHTPAPPKEEVSIEKLAAIKGWQVKGDVEIQPSGPIFEKTKEMVTKLLPEAAGMLKGAVVLKVEEVYTVTPGPEAGKRIA